MTPLTGAAWAGGFNRSVMELTSVVDRCRVPFTTLQLYDLMRCPCAWFVILRYCKSQDIPIFSKPFPRRTGCLSHLRAAVVLQSPVHSMPCGGWGEALPMLARASKDSKSKVAVCRYQVHEVLKSELKFLYQLLYRFLHSGDVERKKKKKEQE